jgi:hypothetical protein
MVIETVKKNGLSYAEAMRRFGIGGDVQIQKWESIIFNQ